MIVRITKNETNIFFCNILLNASTEGTCSFLEIAIWSTVEYFLINKGNRSLKHVRQNGDPKCINYGVNIFSL